MLLVLDKMEEMSGKIPTLSSGETFFSFQHRKYTAFIYRKEKDRETLLRQFPV